MKRNKKNWKSIVILGQQKMDFSTGGRSIKSRQKGFINPGGPAVFKLPVFLGGSRGCLIGRCCLILPWQYLIDVCTYIYMCIHMYAYKYICMCVCMYVYIYIYLYLYIVYISIFKYRYMYM